jgi:hypothetical protein
MHKAMQGAGPGRGTLMADLLRGTAAFTPFAKALLGRRCVACVICVAPVVVCVVTTQCVTCGEVGQLLQQL